MKYVIRTLVILVAPVFIILFSVITLLVFAATFIQAPVIFIMTGQFPKSGEFWIDKWMIMVKKVRIDDIRFERWLRK